MLSLNLKVALLLPIISFAFIRSTYGVPVGPGMEYLADSHRYEVLL